MGAWWARARLQTETWASQRTLIIVMNAFYLFGTVWGAGTGDECDTVADDGGVLDEDAFRVEFIRGKLDDVHAKLAQEAAKSFVLSTRLL